MLTTLLACSPPRVPRPVSPDTVASPTRSEHEDKMLVRVEEGAAQRVVISVTYFTAERGEETKRALSVQRIDPGPPTRFVAYCHKAKALRTFRADRLKGATPDRGLAFVPVDEDELAAYVARSVDGFHGDGAEVTSRFFVKDPEALWVEHNLLTGMRGVRGEGGIDVTVKSASVERVARFVVGLGGAAGGEDTGAQRRRCGGLAEGALGGVRSGTRGLRRQGRGSPEAGGGKAGRGERRVGDGRRGERARCGAALSARSALCSRCLPD